MVLEKEGPSYRDNYRSRDEGHRNSGKKKFRSDRGQHTRHHGRQFVLLTQDLHKADRHRDIESILTEKGQQFRQRVEMEEETSSMSRSSTSLRLLIAERACLIRSPTSMQQCSQSAVGLSHFLRLLLVSIGPLSWSEEKCPYNRTTFTGNVLSKKYNFYSFDSLHLRRYWMSTRTKFSDIQR